MLSFNQHEFSHLLKIAIGFRSIERFCAESKLNHLSTRRYLKGTSDNIPTIRTLIKIANSSEGRVSIQELKKTCGYEGKNSRQVSKYASVNFEMTQEAIKALEKRATTFACDLILATHEYWTIEKDSNECEINGFKVRQGDKIIRYLIMVQECVVADIESKLSQLTIQSQEKIVLLVADSDILKDLKILYKSKATFNLFALNIYNSIESLIALEKLCCTNEIETRPFGQCQVA